MLIRCWGARGSIPVSGPEYVKYGGDTACLELRTGRYDDIIVVDAGSGLRRLSNRLLDEGRRDFTFLFTHAHWDHILGFPFFKPLYSHRTEVRIVGCPMSQGNMETLLARTMSAPYFPVPYDEIRASVVYEEHCSDGQMFDSIKVETIPLSHPNMGVGFRFTEDDKRFVFLTDNELGYRHPGGKTFDDYLAFCKGADLLIHDAEYTPVDYQDRKGWGHSSYEHTLELAIKSGVKQLGLYHHNQDRTDRAMDVIVNNCNEILADRGADIECFGVTQEFEREL